MPNYEDYDPRHPRRGQKVPHAEGEAYQQRGWPSVVSGTVERDRYNRPGVQAQAYYAESSGGCSLVSYALFAGFMLVVIAIIILLA